MKNAIAFYLPQFHEIPENNEWWGEGFTEWTHLKNWTPAFDGHKIKAPHASLGYYNVLDVEVRRSQARLAKEHNVYGFCYYHYWSEGHKLLERPLEAMLQDGEPDLPFMLSWANENWTRKWNGSNQDIIWEQKYGDESDWESHIQYLITFFNHKNYIKVDDKPVLVIYRFNDIPDFERRMEYYRKRVMDAGHEGLHIVVTMGWDGNLLYRPDLSNVVDAVMGFEPNLCLSHLWRAGKYLKEGNSFDIEKHWEFIEDRKLTFNVKYYKGTFVTWDNTPRNKISGMVFGKAKNGSLKNHLTKLIDSTDEDFIFLTAWNEWGEGCIMEPDEESGNSCLEEIRDAFGKEKNLNFVSGGKIGDFIHSLYVIKNICERENAKANIYLSDRHEYPGDEWSLGIDRAYRDLHSLVTTQSYANTFQILPASFDQPCVHLNTWRGKFRDMRIETPSEEICWSRILSNAYNFIIPNDYRWIAANRKDSNTEGKVVIHRSIQTSRHNKNFNWPELLKGISDDILFVTFSKDEWDSFEFKNERIQPYFISTIEEMAVAIASCKYFIGNQSSPFALASALDIPRLVELDDSDYEMAKFYIGENKYSDNISWFLNNDNKFFNNNSPIKL